jgi:glycerol uptake facilitator-like aquaporin
VPAAATVPLARQALAELIGTAFLLMAIVGSGIAAVRLSPGNVGLQLLENSVVTGAALIALILALHPVSAAFNPLVTLVERTRSVIDTRTTVTLVVAQVIGAVIGCALANLMFGHRALELSTHRRDAGGMRLGEVIATAGLLLVIAGTARSGRGERVAVAVGAYILAAYWFTSSTSFANPAVTVARMFSDSFAGIAPGSAGVFLLMQLVGLAAGLTLMRGVHG